MLKRKLIWWLIIAILIAVGISLLGDNHGHIIMVRTPYRIQLSFNLLLLLIVVGFFALHYCLRLMGFLRKLPAKLKAKKEIKQLQSTQLALIESIEALVNDDYEHATRAVKRAQTKVENETLTTLIAQIDQKNTKQLVAPTAVELQDTSST